jgi:hypothetical protein
VGERAKKLPLGMLLEDWFPLFAEDPRLPKKRQRTNKLGQGGAGFGEEWEKAPLEAYGPAVYGAEHSVAIDIGDIDGVPDI